MATGKQSVRQKMINMMYLVLLAILALNVSAEVLKAFYMMEVSMQKTGENIDAKNNLVLQGFANLMVTQPDRTKEWDLKAQEGKKVSEDFVLYIEKLKKELADLSGGRVMDDKGREAEVKNSDNTEKHANYLLNKGKAADLKERINQTRDKLIALVPQEDRKNIRTDLFTLDENGKTWEVINFEGVPIAAVMATMTKLQNDCKNTFTDVLQILYSKVGFSPKSIDSLSAKIIPKSPFVMAGEKFEADVFLTAYDTKQPAEIVLNGQTFSSETGVLKYTTTATGQGLQTIKGTIKVKEKSGLKEYPFETQYNVFSGFAAVSADAMNVMYIGLDNPISISVPGVPTDKVVVSMTNGTLRKDRDNKYIARVTARGETKIKVSVRSDDGTLKSFGEYPYKVRAVPPPVPTLGGLKGSSQSKGSVGLMNRLIAPMGPDFLFNGVSFKVNSYSCYIKSKSDFQTYSVTGDRITEQISNAFKNLRTGDIVIFTNIKSTGPQGQVNLDDVVYTIK